VKRSVSRMSYAPSGSNRNKPTNQPTNLVKPHLSTWTFAWQHASCMLFMLFVVPVRFHGECERIHALGRFYWCAGNFLQGTFNEVIPMHTWRDLSEICSEVHIMSVGCTYLGRVIKPMGLRNENIGKFTLILQPYGKMNSWPKRCSGSEKPVYWPLKIRQKVTF
jgi:hypothetical protein